MEPKTFEFIIVIGAIVLLIIVLSLLNKIARNQDYYESLFLDEYNKRKYEKKDSDINPCL